MRYFLDTEFIEDGRTIEPLSLAVVCEDGREFYAEWMSADITKANGWVQENVLPHMEWLGKPNTATAPQPPCMTKTMGSVWMCDTPRMIRMFLLDFIGKDTPEFWAYYADYDWIVVCQLFGTMMDLPEHFPMLCLDLKQEAIRLGDPELPEQSSVEHHALADAHWNREVWEYLMELDGTRWGR